MKTFFLVLMFSIAVMAESPFHPGDYVTYNGLHGRITSCESAGWVDVAYVTPWKSYREGSWPVKELRPDKKFDITESIWGGWAEVSRLWPLLLITPAGFAIAVTLSILFIYWVLKVFFIGIKRTVRPPKRIPPEEQRRQVILSLTKKISNDIM